MNTYFEEALTVVQSEQFANEFKSTIKFILRLVNLLFLVIAGLFTLVKEFLCRQLSLKEETLPNQITGLMETNDESTDKDINDGVITEASNVETDNTNSILENQTEVISTENDVDLTVEDINNQSDNDKSIRQKELKQMKAAQLRKLCTDYSLQYQNKQQAIVAIFQFEWEQLQANLG
jgi:cytoskeletal protein RodZ